jgi:hypothetical protein
MSHTIDIWYEAILQQILYHLKYVCKYTNDEITEYTNDINNGYFDMDLPQEILNVVEIYAICVVYKKTHIYVLNYISNRWDNSYINPPSNEYVKEIDYIIYIDIGYYHKAWIMPDKDVYFIDILGGHYRIDNETNDIFKTIVI